MNIIFYYLLPLLFIGLSFLFKSSLIFSALVVYLFDAGHVYSTLLESHFDVNHERKKEIYFYTALAFILNVVALLISKNFFYCYLFYFTVFHNMRQGLGVVLVNKSKIKSDTIKYLYYIATGFPFVLFHLRNEGNQLSKDILNPIDLTFLNEYIDLNRSFVIYGFLILGCLIFLLRKKEWKQTFSFLWFSSVYCYAWMISTNAIVSYFILVITHAIPYFWFMYKRVSLTHTNEFVVKNSVILLLALFAAGGLFDYLHDDRSYSGNFLLDALFFTPLITHFLIDGIIWKKKDARFGQLLDKDAL
jgi:hypothetical protein